MESSAPADAAAAATALPARRHEPFQKWPALGSHDMMLTHGSFSALLSSKGCPVREGVSIGLCSTGERWIVTEGVEKTRKHTGRVGRTVQQDGGAPAGPLLPRPAGDTGHGEPCCIIDMTAGVSCSSRAPLARNGTLLRALRACAYARTGTEAPARRPNCSVVSAALCYLSLRCL